MRIPVARSSRAYSAAIRSMSPCGSASRKASRSGTSTPYSEPVPRDLRRISVMSARYGMIVPIPAWTSTVAGPRPDPDSRLTAGVAGASRSPAPPWPAWRT
ncbi:hypothetical protein BC477_09130 [Clavibacter michiganensis subsp. michiganensis]|uniref:Uncharacterized protein n=1 Tax=Clavibacter michiganensis subsp. michiganensis TaxID=33013 RepID=A0A251XN55_CLAMM|nr:hypothetical protein BC477_09130 [Clavibacter michiganensis subsp. michiganensis]OUE04887.1 hypothetical protein CMMCAS07_08055 [Clavibacter michiganensis subsp. michiganensis]